MGFLTTSYGCGSFSQNIAGNNVSPVRRCRLLLIQTQGERDEDVEMSAWIIWVWISRGCSVVFAVAVTQAKRSTDSAADLESRCGEADRRDLWHGHDGLRSHHRALELTLSSKP
ncbi:hypothetical protein L1987_43572 [Smallanthus sonchifolius]|uniref:Uncharacterized protein n=1 Tax=Smallanthus sonchifolius TaxID=185202 RepID=A0ACB9GN34_9ASTR|nr:hypothetical protein L1987_43572 [Smallanthus sonchifolius]